MAVNRGKQFEDQIREALERVPKSVTLRLHDQTTGYLGSSNPCDFIFYHNKRLHLIECKSCHKNRLPFSNFSDTQLEAIKYEHDGAMCWVAIWFIDHDRTLLIPLWYILDLIKQGEKSVPWDISGVLEIPGKKKRVLFDYDFEGVL